MISNYKFLEENFPVLYQVGSAAEKYLYTDASACLIKLGMFGETVVNLMIKLDGLELSNTDSTHLNRIKLLRNNGLLPKDIDDILHSLRITRNSAVHSNYEDLEKCKILLQMTHTLANWFMQTYGSWQYELSSFAMPLEEEKEIDYDSIIQEKERIIQELNNLVNEIKSQNISLNNRKERSERAASLIDLSEKETRYIIDEQLRKVGWEANTEVLRYSKGTVPQKNRNIAIAEWPTDSIVSERGYADYALFVGLKLVGIIEAKKAFTDIPSVIDNQCKDYAKLIKESDAEYVINKWNDYKVPFLFATNGRKYFKQLETKSGIWFLDVRENTNMPKALQGWMSPDGIMELLEHDIENANNKLNQDDNFKFLKDEDGLNLRPYQIEAIEKAKEAVVSGEDSMLISMATGTGKTRTILGLMYVFLKTGRFKRVLFLVDRTSLGEQAQDVFKDVKIEDLMTLDNIYNIKSLDDRYIDKETKIQVATIQSMIKRILSNDEDTMPAVSDFDLVVIDEAHRGYVLDKEMGEDELLYRNQDDYISKYRTVIEYFDAVKIALTATPALHTKEIFKKLIYNYTYRQAVIEGYLVDFDAPHNIKTKLRVEGINYEKGDTVAIYNPVTGEIENSEELEDEIKFDVEKFNRQVITESFNKTVLEEIANDINPEGEGKTLIYAVDDQHADLIVKILKEIYSECGVDNDAIMKITGSIGGGDKKKVLEAIKRFKTEKYPNIVVTVDLLTTGIDVPKINTLVFMRRVKSRILFEQMLGRATRLCPEINKTHFEIYDPVGVYESLQSVNTMKPLVTNSTATFDDLLNGLDVLPTEEKIQNQIDLIIAKLQRKKRNLSENQIEQFKNLSDGKTPSQFIESLKNMSTNEAKNLLINCRNLFATLNEGGLNPKRAVVISDKTDKLLSHTRGFGEGLEPEDYLEAFKEFITENMNKIAALNILCTRPKELTREGLKKLRLELDKEGFTNQQLNTAYNESNNEEIVADIISFIRRYALGSVLLSHEQRIKNAVNKLKKNHKFSKMELDWLARIENYLINENIIEKDSFESGAFKTFGGFKRIDKVFNNNLDNIIQELNEYLYEDGGVIA